MTCSQLRNVLLTMVEHQFQQVCGVQVERVGQREWMVAGMNASDLELSCGRIIRKMPG